MKRRIPVQDYNEVSLQLAEKNIALAYKESEVHMQTAVLARMESLLEAKDALLASRDNELVTTKKELADAHKLLDLSWDKSKLAVLGRILDQHHHRRKYIPGISF